jgi:hypothetical protein
MPDEPSIVHVAAAPPKTLEPGLVTKAAAIIGKDPYTTRLLLIGKIPKIVASYQTVEEAQAVAGRLRALGLAAFACDDSEIRGPLPSIPRARTLLRCKAEITLMKSGGETQAIGPGDVFLILKGTRQTGSGEETVNITRKINLAATLLSGMPVFRKVKEKTKEAFQTESFIRIYGRGSVEPRVEIQQNDFGYSFLGDRLAPSSYENLNNTAAFLREIFPQAVYDDTLAAHPDATETNCRLLYLYHKTREVF